MILKITYCAFSSARMPLQNPEARSAVSALPVPLLSAFFFANDHNVLFNILYSVFFVDGGTRSSFPGTSRWEKGPQLLPPDIFNTLATNFVLLLKCMTQKYNPFFKWLMLIVLPFAWLKSRFPEGS